MRPLPYVWPYALVFWTIFVWAFLPEFKIIRASRAGTSTDAKSLQVIMVGMNAAFLGSFFLAWIPALRMTSYVMPAFWLGIVLLISGSLLRRHCFRMLGESFTGDVRASSDQHVVTRGAYSILRHPSYTGGLLMNAGVGIGLGSWASALLMTVGTLAVYSYRIAVEERALSATIGEPYREFMSTRKRIIPFIY
ncbi:MAG: isoprenylcysteine carboxylmethyltransferase family protein [Gemmatimonadaceae bacterium]